MLLHAQFAANTAANIIIKSLDTDVFIISVGMSWHIQSNLLLHTGKGATVRTVNIQEIRQQLGESTTNALIGLHALTGCDSIFGLYGKGKIKAATLMYKHQEYQTTLGNLGIEKTITNDLLEGIEMLVCHLYGQQNCKDVNAARYNAFLLGATAEQQLPPTKDALTKHVMRANYQAAIWRRSLDQDQYMPNPDGYGWSMKDGMLWGQSSPQIVMLLNSLRRGKHVIYLGWSSSSVSLYLYSFGIM